MIYAVLLFCVLLTGCAARISDNMHHFHDDPVCVPTIMRGHFATLCCDEKGCHPVN